MTHYFETPTSEERRRTIDVRFWDTDWTFTTAAGVFSGDGLDLGTGVLLRTHTPDAGARRILDLGCGYGVLTVAAASAAPGATVDAVDTNERALALTRLNGIMDKLLVYPKRMKENMESLRGLVFSQAVLLALTQAGMSREYAYALVQEHAMKVWGSDDVQFLHLLLEDETVDEYLSEEVLKNIFNYRHCIERTADVIARVLEQE